MILITGGRYQGKLNLVLSDKKYKISDVCDFSCLTMNDELLPDYADKKIWYNIDLYIRMLARQGMDNMQIQSQITSLYEAYDPEVIVISETGSGIVPIDKFENTYREATGNVSVYFSSKADEVYRVICGLKMKLK